MADKRISQLVERVNIANNDVLPIVASGATTTNKVTVSTLQDWMQSNLDVGVTSVGLSMPSAFVVSNSPVTGSGNISVTGAGTVSQYIRGDGSLADFPSGGGGGGSSVNYYLNGSVSQGTIGGIAYQEMNKVPVLGAGTDFTIAADGYIASFITDAGDPALLEIPAGNWNFETYLQASSGGGTPSFYIELYKVNSGGTATLIASNSGSPELIAFGTAINPYFSALAVPQTTLALTDRLALRYYVTHSGRTITLHTENATLCEISTTFTTGLTALNGLTAQVQNFATGTSGTDFGITSSVSTHTFNLPNASATARGVVSTGSQTFAGAKTFSSDINVNGVNVGRGASNIPSNTRIGNATLNNITTGANNTAVGFSSLIFTTTGTSNTAIGHQVLSNTNGQLNTALGVSALFNHLSGDNNIAVGVDAGSNIAVGTAQTISNHSIFIGYDTRANVNNETNQIVIGYAAIGNGSNTVTIGNSSITNNYFTGNIRGGAFIKSGGTSSQFLKADGSVDSSTYLTTGTAASTYVPYSGATSNVDLGVNTFTSSSVIVNGVGSNSGIIHLESNAFHSLIHGYGSISSGTTNQFNLYQTTGAGVFRCAILSLNSITASATRTYTLPDADGTLALTSDLSGYVTLATTQTITGNKSIITGGGGNTLTVSQTSGTGVSLSISKYGNGEGLKVEKFSGSGNAVTITGGLLSAEAATLTGALNGTSASFGSLVTISADSGGSALRIIGRAAADAGAIRFFANNNTTQNARIESNSSEFEINSISNLPMVLKTNDTARLTISSTGAATFSSSVKATSIDSVFKEGYIIQASTTSGGGSQPAYTYYTAAGSKRWSHFLNVGDDKFHIANASNSELFTIQQNGNVGIGTASPGSTLDIVGLGVTSPTGTGSSNIVALLRDTTAGGINVGAGIGFAGNDGVNTGVTFATINGRKENATSGDFASYLAFQTRANGGALSERMRITSGGNVWVGNDSNPLLEIANGGSTDVLSGIRWSIGGSRVDYGGIYSAVSSSNNNYISFYTKNSASAPSERMRITSGGNVVFNNSAVSPFFGGENTTSASANLQSWNKANTGDNKFVEFYTEGGTGTLRGSIDFNRGAGLVRYNTTSDANLKNIIGDSDKSKSIEILNSTKIREYSWKDDESNKPQIGVIAQELHETFKGAVSVGSDEELLGTEDYKPWAVDKTAFTFHLIAGWQEHQRIIQELKTEIDSLKNQMQ